MKLVLVMIIILLSIILGVVIAGFYRTWQVQHDQRQQIFLKGTLPHPSPDGFYQGEISLKTSWKGKKFDPKNGRGINLYGQAEKFPFKTYQGKGLTDKNLDVLKIDYNIAGNPFWLRFVLDEIVQVGPNEYLGKMHFRIIPGSPFSITYFWLKK